jgi:proline iminopeptidase
MKAIFILTNLFLTAVFVNGQNLYIKTFGKTNDRAIIFLHGGPGYNCASFEATTARNLSDKGFFVIVYDRRGEGRSKDPNAAYTFKETFDDLNIIYEQYGIKKSTLIGHSYGGVIATLFAGSYPDKIQSIVFVGAPVSLQETFKTIIAKSKSMYAAKKDSTNLHYITMLESMDTTGIDYSSYCLRHAMQNGFYSVKNSTDEAKSIHSKFRTDTLNKFASQMSFAAPMGFWKNEKYTIIDLTANIKSLQTKKVRIYGLYGKEDGLYSGEQVQKLQNLIGESNLKYLDNCSHSVFIDQQTQFLDAVKGWAR